MVAIHGMSANSWQDLLLDYAHAAQGKLKQIFLVHDEAGPAEDFQSRLAQEKIGPVTWPNLRDCCEI